MSPEERHEEALETAEETRTSRIVRDLLFGVCVVAVANLVGQVAVLLIDVLAGGAP